MADDRQRLFEMVDRMPTFSQSVVRILQLTSDIDTAPKELVRLVEHDPILTMKVLKLVNSAYFGLGKKLTSIKQGVVYVGINTIKHLAVSIAAIGALPRDNDAGFDMNAFWSHSLATAAAAKLVAQRQGAPRTELTGFFIAGLLHDIGQVVLAQFMPAAYRAVLAQAREGGAHIAALEADALGTTHAELGALLAEHWKLPAEFVSAIRNHHDPVALAGAGAIDRAVFAGNQVAKLLDDPASRLSPVEPLPEAVQAWLGVPIDELPAQLEGLQTEIEAARAFVQVSGS